jgi:hypothetical protein
MRSAVAAAGVAVLLSLALLLAVANSGASANSGAPLIAATAATTAGGGAAASSPRGRAVSKSLRCRVKFDDLFGRPNILQLKVKLLGSRRGEKISVSQLQYSFTSQRGPQPLGNKNNLRISAPGRTLWSSGDDLKSGKRQKVNVNFVLFRRQAVWAPAVFDLFGTDRRCTAQGRIA